MVEITPRWEWRTFGERFGEAEMRIKSARDAKLRESSETYILSRRSHENTKIRHGLLDIKRLKQINPDQLEQWMPIVKVGFPLDHAVLEEIFAGWRIGPPTLAREEYDRESFLEELVAPHPDLRTVEVVKKRCRCLIHGCLVELADLTFDGQPIRTVAVEMEEAERVLLTVGGLGLAGLANINYIRALKQFANV